MAIETPGQAEESTGFVRRLALVLATAGGAGYAPIAPGTAGSAVALPLFVLLALLGPYGFAGAVVVLLVAGIWASSVAERVFAKKDDGRIVIDEVVGQLLTLAPLALVPGLWPERVEELGFWLVTGFVAFRLLDIWKPGPIRGLQEMGGGTGVVMDDVAAGLVGAVPLGLGAWIVPLVFGAGGG